MVNILGFAGQTLSVTKTQLCHLQHESSRRPYIHEWSCLCPSKTFNKQEVDWVWPASCKYSDTSLDVCQNLHCSLTQAWLREAGTTFEYFLMQWVEHHAWSWENWHSLRGQNVGQPHFKIRVLTWGQFWPPGDTGQCLETFLVVAKECGAVLLTCNGWRPGVLFNTLRCTGHPVVHRTAHNKGLSSPKCQ